MDPDKSSKPYRRPEVFKKINTENLLLIERGLLGDVPEKLRPQLRPNDLPIPKFVSVFSPHLNDEEKQTPSSPDLEKATPVEDDASPLKKSFSFRDKFFRKSFFGKKQEFEKNKFKPIDVEVYKEEVVCRRSPVKYKDKDQDNKSKRFWFRKSKEDKERKQNNIPIYKRSKSFEFLPRALDEEEKPPKGKNLLKNRHSFIHSSNDSLNNLHVCNEYVIDETQEDSVFEDKKIQYYIGDDKASLSPKISLKEASSLSTVNSSTNSSVPTDNPLLTTSFLDLCDKFDKVVEYFNENYSSDCEPYTQPVRRRGLKVNREKRKSSSFSTLPSPKIVHLNTLKVSEISESFKNELSKVISRKNEVCVLPIDYRSGRRGSVTDWFVLEESVKNSNENIKLSGIENNKYRRAQKKPVNRVRRISSTKYVSFLPSMSFD